MGNNAPSQRSLNSRRIKAQISTGIIINGGIKNEKTN